MAESAFVVSTVAGCLEGGCTDGRGISTKFNSPHGLAFTRDGGILVADTSNHCIRKVTITGRSPAQVETFAGVPGQPGYRDGEGANALFCKPSSVSVSDDGTVYVADTENYRLRTVSKTSRIPRRSVYVRHGCLSSGPWPLTNIDTPAGDAAAPKIDKLKTVRTLAGSGKREVVDGKGTDASFVNLHSVTWIRGAGLYIGGSCSVIRRVTEDGVVSTEVGTPYQEGHHDGDSKVAKFGKYVYQISWSGSGRKFVADSNNHAIRVINPDGIVGTIAGGSEHGYYQDGPIDLSRFHFPTGVVVDDDGQIFVADFLNHRVCMISPGNDGVPVVSTIAGCGGTGRQDGLGKFAKLQRPFSLLLDHATSTLYFTQDHCLRKISLPKKQCPKLESSMLRDLQSLTTDDPVLADVVFIVEGKPVYAGKRLLSVRCEYFNRMFSSGMKESVNSSAKVTEIPIQDVDYESFKALIVYLTTDRLTVDSRDYKRVCQLLVACDRFMVDRLKVYCERVLENKIQSDNVFELVHVADRHGAEHLKDAALTFVSQHITELRDKPEMTQLPPQFLVDLIS